MCVLSAEVQRVWADDQDVNLGRAVFWNVKRWFFRNFRKVFADSLALFLDLSPLSSGMIPSVQSTVLRTPSFCSRCADSKSEFCPDAEPKMENSSQSRMVFGSWSIALLRRGQLRHTYEYLNRVRRWVQCAKDPNVAFRKISSSTTFGIQCSSCMQLTSQDFNNRIRQVLMSSGSATFSKIM